MCLDEKCSEMKIETQVASTYKGQVEEKVPRHRPKKKGWRHVRRARRVRSHGRKRLERSGKRKGPKCQMQQRRSGRMLIGFCT